MKQGLLFILLILMVSCAGAPEIAHKEGRSNFAYTDVSGKYSFNRETKIVKKRLVTRSVLTDVNSNKIVEKSVTVSQIGTVKSKKARVLTVRPMGSEFTVWLEGKKYSSYMRLLPQKKSMSVRVESPEPNQSGTTEVSFPRGRYFCFYSQIPDCLYQNQFLQRSFKSPKEELEFYVVWDSYPFVQEQYSGIGKKLFAKARLKFDGEVKKRLRYMVELEDQAILYHFTKTYDLAKIAWIAQGITVVPPGEEMPDEEQ